MNAPTLGRLFLMFAALSLMAVGGANALIPEMHRQVVDLNHWMTGAEFAGLFAIAQASPGPNMLIVSVLGLKLAGLPGALVATLAFCLPSSLLSFAVARVRQRFEASPWRRAIERGLAPVTVGLVLGSGCLLASAAGCDWHAYLLSAGVALLALTGRFNNHCLMYCGYCIVPNGHFTILTVEVLALVWPLSIFRRFLPAEQTH